jgi:uncharacterized OB-fold protein
MGVGSIGVYRPAWVEGSRRVSGPDEDVVTMAVAAAQIVTRDDGCDVERLVLVTNEPDHVEGMDTAVIRYALHLPDSVSVEIVLGAAPQSLAAVAEAAPKTLVVAVDVAPDSRAVAVLVAEGGVALELLGRVDLGLPMRVRSVGRKDASVYEDPRVERALGWGRAVAALGGVIGADPLFAGIGPRDAEKLGGQSVGDVRGTGAAAALDALGHLIAAGAGGTLTALDAGAACAVKVGSGRVPRKSDVRLGLPSQLIPTLGQDVSIPFSMPAYVRAAKAKFGLTGAECACGELSFPPRTHCLNCGRQGATEPIELPRSGSVYTVVTVHTPVPGLATPYALAVISLHQSPVRVLAKVTDVRPTDCSIGMHGRLVLRRTAIREGVPDYGFAFQPDETREDAKVAS